MSGHSVVYSLRYHTTLFSKDEYRPIDFRLEDRVTIESDILKINKKIQKLHICIIIKII